VSDDIHVSVFSSLQPDLLHCTPHNSRFLAGCETVPEGMSIIDVVFSSDGSSIIAAVGSVVTQKVIDIYCWKIRNIDNMPIRGVATLTTPTVMSLHKMEDVNGMSPDKLLRIVSLNSHSIVTVRSVLHTGLHNGSSQNSVCYILHVFNMNPNPIQTLSIQLPLFHSRLPANSSSLANPLLDCSLCCENSNGRYLVLSSRRSNLIACIAAAPPTSAAIPVVLYHVTFLNLKAPVVSMDVSSIMDREFENAEEEEQLELSCYQEEASDQASIQQYHATFRNLFDRQKYIEKHPHAEVQHQETPALAFSHPIIASTHLPSHTPLHPDANHAMPTTSSGMTVGKSILDTLARSHTTSYPNPIPPTTPTSSPAAALQQPRVSSINTTTATSHSSVETHSTTHAPHSQTQQTTLHSSHTTITDTAIPKVLQFEAAKNMSILSLIKPPKTIPSVPASSPSIPAIPITASTMKANSAESPGSATQRSEAVAVLSAVNEVRQLVEETRRGILGKQGLHTLREEVLSECRHMETQALEQLSVVVKQAVETEARRAVEEALKASSWKKELSAELDTCLRAETVPMILQKVKDSTRDTVRDAVKTTLGASFRTAFEKSLLPAFEAGTNRMFGQIQSTFEEGLGRLLEESTRTVQITKQNNEELRAEVRELQGVILRMEGAVNELLSQRASQTGPGAGEDPASLLAKGLVHEAVVCALERNDIHVLLSILDRLSSAQLLAKCSHLVILCVTQQLAADMSVNMPKEGIAKRVNWIKELVLKLINAKQDASNGDFQRNFKSVMQTVLESIQAAGRLIRQSQQDNGDMEDDNAVNYAVQASVQTDLQLLEHLIKSRI